MLSTQCSYFNVYPSSSIKEHLKLKSKQVVLIFFTLLVEYIRLESPLLSKGVSGPCFQWCGYHWESKVGKRGVWKYRSTCYRFRQRAVALAASPARGLIPAEQTWGSGCYGSGTLLSRGCSCWDQPSLTQLGSVQVWDFEIQRKTLINYIFSMWPAERNRPGRLRWHGLSSRSSVLWNPRQFP